MQLLTLYKTIMIKIIKYSIYDLMRSKWNHIYFLFYFILGFVLLFFNNNISKSIITLMNIIVVLTPLIGAIFGAMYYYSSKEFIMLLLAQPLKRRTIFLGQFLGLAISLSLSFVLGIGIPFLSFGVLISYDIFDFISILLVGIVLTFVFTSISYNIAIANENQIKGMGLTILAWLFMAVIYDGIFLISLLIFEEYPIDYFALGSSMLNPIDLSRILIILKLDTSALLGYTGAVFQDFFGTQRGMIITIILLMLWITAPVLILNNQIKKKDF